MPSIATTLRPFNRLGHASGCTQPAVQGRCSRVAYNKNSTECERHQGGRWGEFTHAHASCRRAPCLVLSFSATKPCSAWLGSVAPQYDDEEAEPDVDFADVHSGLDFVRACVRHAFDLTTPQAGALLQDNAKYLALVITNGMKGTFDAVFDLYDTVRAVQYSAVQCCVCADSCAGPASPTLLCLGLQFLRNTRKLGVLMAHDPSSLTDVLGCFRPGLLSKDEEVCAVACDVFVAVA